MNRRPYPDIGKACIALPSLPRLHFVTSTSTPLLNCTAAGFQYYNDCQCVKIILPGDRLDLIQEPKNLHDKKAIAVHAPHDGKLGYLLRDLNEITVIHPSSSKSPSSDK